MKQLLQEEQTQPPGCDATLMFSSETPVSSDSGSDINHRSLSPWSWSSTTVKNRIPSTLWKAECNSNYCESPNPGLEDYHDLESKPVYQTILVLNRKEGERCYTVSFQSIPVGCTCVRPK
ncbi:interleukin-17A-like, partial [Austrofundulus limnaeus]|uniref:Interleukin-17A-like n=1 Tax=Austrofundulus limnaeus TaxID=52670 RepID=A0A2I4CQW9_AUSLI